MIGHTISHYIILEHIGAGGMGVVYKAEDTKLKRLVALKFLPAAFATDPTTKERFINEAQSASALEHPNICNIHEIDESEDGQLFISMAYYEGETLQNKIKYERLRSKEAIEYTLQIAEGLRKAHEKGIIHRDIKPANIIITNDEEAKILDFGLAKFRGQSKLSKSGSTLGTVAYMSPEQARGEEVDYRTDIWSLGVMLCEMVTGELPFNGEYEQGLVYAIINEDPDLSKMSDIPNSVEIKSIIQKCLTKDLNKRYQHIDMLVNDLKDIGEEVNSVHIKKSKNNRLIVYPLILITLLIILIGAYFISPSEESIDSIAVLPLANHSGDPSQEYFSDGMTEAIISELANIKALKVISRTSAMCYKNTDKLLPEIANELNVEAILEGSILRVGEKVRITAQLIKADEDQHLWAKNYERDLKNILLLQREVAQDIVDGVKVSLSEQEKGALSSERSIVPQAYEAYLQGKYHWNKRSEADLNKSIQYFEKAIEIDSNYAEAYAGLAQTYIVMVAWNFMDAKEGDAKSSIYAKKALELNDRLSSGYVALGANLEQKWRWKEAEEAYKKAIELSPNNATAHQWYSEILTPLGRHQEAIYEMQIARDLDPLSEIIIHNSGLTYCFAREYNAAKHYFNRIISLNEDFGNPHYFLYLISLANSEYDMAIKHIKDMFSKDEEMKNLIDTTERTYQTKGINGYRRWVIEYMKSHPEDMVPYEISIHYAALSEPDSAFKWLEMQYTNKTNFIRHLNVDPLWDNLRSDPRFNDLLRRMNLIP